MPQLRSKPSNVYLAPAHLNHIRATIDWQALFNELGLKKAPQRSKADDWWAFSPFKEERTPSFHMGIGGIWYDFSAGIGGGPIELVQKMHNLNCYEAANYILERGWARSAALIQTQQETVKAKVIEASAEYANAPIRQDLLPMCTYHDYLAERGISEETCEALGIGFLPQGRSPLRGRVVFQIRDARLNTETDEREKVILSHMGRAVTEEKKPKYLFYEGFKKSAELYGQEQLWLDPEARRQIQETGHIVLTEGSMDVAKAYEAGLRNVVACFGSKLSKAQVIQCQCLCAHHNITKVLLCFDRDNAGNRGALTALQMLTEYGLECEVFEWEANFGSVRKIRNIDANTKDMSDFEVKQLQWLRSNALI